LAARGLAGWFYRGGKPNAVAWWINRISGAIYALGVLPNYAVELEVVGRRSGQPIRFPLVMALLEGERYLVSMLGTDVAWVRNLGPRTATRCCATGASSPCGSSSCPSSDAACTSPGTSRIAWATTWGSSGASPDQYTSGTSISFGTACLE
jgi:hypothetical protein